MFSNNGGHYKRKIAKWKIKEDLEDGLKIMRRGKRETVSIIATMLKIGIDKGGFNKQPTPIIKTKLAVREGKHSPSMVSSVFYNLFEYRPIIFKHVEESPYDEGKDGQFTLEAYGILTHDIEVYKKLDINNLLSDLDRSLIQIIDERLKKFYGF